MGYADKQANGTVLGWNDIVWVHDFIDTVWVPDFKLKTDRATSTRVRTLRGHNNTRVRTHEHDHAK